MDMWSLLFSGADSLPSLRLVKTVGGQMEALIVKSRLEAERIPVHLRYEPAGLLYGFSATNLGRVDILVPEAFAEAALTVCGEMRGPASEGDAV